MSIIAFHFGETFRKNFVYTSAKRKKFGGKVNQYKKKQSVNERTPDLKKKHNVYKNREGESGDRKKEKERGGRMGRGRKVRQRRMGERERERGG